MSDNNLLAVLAVSFMLLLAVAVTAITARDVIILQTAVQNGYSQTTLPGTSGSYWTK